MWMNERCSHYILCHLPSTEMSGLYMHCKECRNIAARLAVHAVRELLLLQQSCVKAWGFLLYTGTYLSSHQHWQYYAGFSLQLLELTNLSGRNSSFSYRLFIITIASGLEESKPLKEILLSCVLSITKWMFYIPWMLFSGGRSCSLLPICPLRSLSVVVRQFPCCRIRGLCRRWKLPVFKGSINLLAHVKHCMMSGCVRGV